jgi:hypothetical protein
MDGDVMKHEKMMLAWANVAMKFAYLEWEVQELLGDIIDSGEGLGVGMLACDNYSFAKKIDKLKELAEFRLYEDKELTNLILELCIKIGDVRVVRNSFVHGNWMMSDKLIENKKMFLQSGSYRKCKRKSSVFWGISIDEWSIADFNELSHRIDEIYFQIKNFKKTYHDKLWQLMNHKPRIEVIEDFDYNDEFERRFSEETYNLFEYERIRQNEG